MNWENKTRKIRQERLLQKCSLGKGFFKTQGDNLFLLLSFYVLPSKCFIRYVTVCDVTYTSQKPSIGSYLKRFLYDG